MGMMNWMMGLFLMWMMMFGWMGPTPFAAA